MYRFAASPRKTGIVPLGTPNSPSEIAERSAEADVSEKLRPAVTKLVDSKGDISGRNRTTNHPIVQTVAGFT